VAAGLAPPCCSKNVSSFMNIRLADIQARYKEWRAKRATFLTPPNRLRGRDSLLYAGPGRLLH
jgi:hypothetical protein